MHRLFLPCVLAFLGTALAAPQISAEQETDPQKPFKLKLRRQISTAPGSTDFQSQVVNESWDPKKTAVVVCDMWDKHWCRGATRRVAEMAPHMNEVISAARDQGMLIIHCPSSCMSFYKDTPMRMRAQQATPVATKIPLENWCHLDEEREAALPIDDSDGGCDCWPRCAAASPWRRQIEAIEIEADDAITDSAEAYYLMKQRGITNVMVMGVHTNMCVLGRPFSIRQMVYQGQNVVLVRDLTDTMYNSRRTPHVPHTEGTRLVIDHIEKYWCPTIASTDLTGKPPFRFAEEGKPHIVFLIGEREYKTKDTLPFFARHHLEPRGIRCTIVHADAADGNIFSGIEALKTADLLLVSVRRRALPQGQLALVREHLDKGKPLVGIRTANHAFHTRGQRPAGHAEWQDFDAVVLGGNYTGHHPNGPTSQLKATEIGASHSILENVSVEAFRGNGSLYQVLPLVKEAVPLVVGSIEGQSPEPVAWTHRYGAARVFYTSLGHPDDFDSDDFNRLLTNAVFWALEKD